MQAEDEKSCIHDAQKKLELMTKNLSQRRRDGYEYLLFIGVFQVFGFQVQRFQFDYHLTKTDFKNVSKMLEDHEKHYNKIKKRIQQQAYILNLALCCVDQKETAVRHAVKRMSGDLETGL